MDQAQSQEPTRAMGPKLREMRLRRGLSMRALARASGLSANAISMVERGRSSPSVNTLAKLASALEIPVSDFFEGESERRDVVFMRASARRGEAFALGQWESLGGELFSGPIEAYLFNLDVGAGGSQKTIEYRAYQMALCLRGLISFQVLGETFLLQAGDCILLRSGLKHRWSNHGITEARLLIVLSGFEESDRPRMIPFCRQP